MTTRHTCFICHASYNDTRFTKLDKTLCKIECLKALNKQLKDAEEKKEQERLAKSNHIDPAETKRRELEQHMKELQAKWEATDPRRVNTLTYNVNV